MPFADIEQQRAWRKRYYQANRAKAITDAREWAEANREADRAGKRAHKQRLTQWLDDVKRESGCVDCGTREGRLDFDHRPGTVKLFNPSRLDRGRVALEAEIAKCDVRCAPCHTRRHQAAKDLATHCRRGHEFTPENTRVDKDGVRRCRTCTRERRRKTPPPGY